MAGTTGVVSCSACSARALDAWRAYRRRIRFKDPHATPRPPQPPTHEHAISGHLTRSHGQPPHGQPARPEVLQCVRPQNCLKPPKPSATRSPLGRFCGHDGGRVPQASPPAVREHLWPENGLLLALKSRESGRTPPPPHPTPGAGSSGLWAFEWLRESRTPAARGHRGGASVAGSSGRAAALLPTRLGPAGWHRETSGVEWRPELGTLPLDFWKGERRPAHQPPRLTS